jgi:hypothetical protein
VFDPLSRAVYNHEVSELIDWVRASVRRTGVIDFV